MMNIKSNLIALLLLLGISFGSMGTLSAQPYDHSLGVRGGFQQGLTWKHFRTEETAIDLIVGHRVFIRNSRSFRITGLYLIHVPALDVNNLYWYYGGGAHIGSYGSENQIFIGESVGGIIAGVDGALGMEYIIGEIPFNAGIDLKPSLTFYDEGIHWAGIFDLALSVRYIF
jgi:hypothetical protein